MNTRDVFFPHLPEPSIRGTAVAPFPALHQNGTVKPQQSHRQDGLKRHVAQTFAGQMVTLSPALVK